MELLYILLVLLLVTRVFGEIAERLGQPALVGELISGVFLGVLVGRYHDAFPILSTLDENEIFAAVTELAMFFLMLVAGVEMRPKDIAKATGLALPVALGGMIVPLAGGFALGWLFLPDSQLLLAQSAFIAVALAVTAVPVTIKLLIDLGLQNSRVGNVVVSAAIFDDIFSLALLAILTALAQSGGIPDITALAWLAGKVLLFLVITLAIGRYLFGPVGRLVSRLKLAHIELSLLMAWALAFAVLAEWLGMHFIVGAFAAGLFFTRQTFDNGTYRRLDQNLRGITLGFFAPVFFASIGFHLELDVFTGAPGFLTALIGIAILGKVLGSGLPAYVSGLSARESLAVGVGMNARGAVELIIADVALRAGIFDKPEPVPPIVGYLFSSVVVMAIVTTLVAPIAMRQLLAGSADVSRPDSAGS